MVVATRWMAGLVVVMMLGGCGMSSGVKKKALYLLPKERRILVFVDVHPTVMAPSGFASKLGESISSELYQHKVVDKVVAQGKLDALRREPEKLKDMGVQDVAKAVDSDVVVYVDIITFDVSSSSDDALTQGLAQVLVKVIDANGKRLWPVMDVNGAQVDESVDPALTESQDQTTVTNKLRDKLARDVGRLFHDYNTMEGSMRDR